MTAGFDMAMVAALVGDPARANMLAAMLDGRAHTAAELAQLAGISEGDTATIGPPRQRLDECSKASWS
jgi:uridine phosphorylase